MPRRVKKNKRQVQKTEPKKIEEPIKSTREIKKIPDYELWMILTISTLVSLFFIHQRVEKLSDYISISDETDIIRGVKMGVGTANYETIFNNKALKPYKLECHLRYPVYSFLKDTLEDWKSWSNLVYLYLVLLLMVIYALMRKIEKLPVIIIAFTLILLATSYWTSSSFHYVRYFAFLIISSLLSLFICTEVFNNHRTNPYLKAGLILVVAALPALFHFQGAFMLLFWLPISMYIVGKELLKNRKNKINIALIITYFLILSLIIYFGRGYIKAALNIVDLDAFFPILVKFIELSFPRSYLGLAVVFAMFSSPVLTWKHLTKKEKSYIAISGGLFIFSTVLSASIMGNNYSGYNGANRYFTFSHAIFLVFFSSLIQGLYKFTVHLLTFKLNNTVIFGALLILLTSGIFKLTTLNADVYNFSLLPQVKLSDLKEIKSEISDVDYAVIANHTPNAMSAFPKKEVYHVQLLSEDEFLDTISANYLLFYHVPMSKLEEEIAQKLQYLGRINTDLMLIPVDSLDLEIDE